MTTRQFYFSLSTGIALLAGGSVAALSGTAGWGLFWVGGIVSTLALTSLRQRSTAGLATAPVSVLGGES